MKKVILMLAVFLAGIQYLSAQNVTVTGVVTLQEDGTPAIGASVMEKGTKNGVITDFDGNFSITVPVGATLEFQYLGTLPQSRKITGAAKLDIALMPDAVTIGEVVVTAMGVKTEKKKMNFAVQSLGEEAITEGREANFVQALQGKIAGISVTTAGGSPTDGASVLIRGIASVNTSQSNQPLYVLDGVPISGGPADINPNDIENVTILKGAAASALYGQQGKDGVIMVTTKRGAVGTMKLTANAVWQIDDVVRVPEQQTLYGPGARGFYKPESAGGAAGWGPPLAPGTPIYNNAKNYFRQGLYQKYDASVSGGSEKFQTYSSLGFTIHDGTIVNNFLDKMTFLIKGNYEVSKNLSIDASINIIKDKYRGQGTGSDNVGRAYSWPITDDIRNYRDGDFPRFRYINEARKETSPISPLWNRYMNWAENNNTRNIMTGSIIYKPVKGLQLTGRLGYEQNYDNYEAYDRPRFDATKLYPAFTGDPESPTYADDLAAYNQAYYQSPILSADDLQNLKSGDNRGYLGYYDYRANRSNRLTATGMVNYSYNINKDFTVEAMVGSELRMNTGIDSEMDGRIFKVPGFYHILNTEDHTLSDINLDHTETRRIGLFGELRFDYKGLASVSATYRGDWSSTIRPEHNPYTYPSVTGGLVFSELFNIAGPVFSYGKLRGNWARVGGDAPANQFDRRYSSYPALPDGGFGADPGLSTASSTLSPEIMDSWEVGADLRFFNSRTRLDIAYYSTSVYNQIVTVRVSPASGFILQTRNEGWVTNSGLEASFEQDILKNKDFTWTAGLNFSFNRGKLKGLPEELPDVPLRQYADVFATAYLNGPTMALSGKDYLRTDDGQIIIDNDGYPVINPLKAVLLGNREPDFLLGFHNTFRYKNVSLDFLLDGRKGGVVLNNTARGMFGSGQAKMLENYRGRQVVWEGVVEQPDGSYKPNTKPIVLNYETLINKYQEVSSNFIEDGSYIRLSYVTLQYDFSNLLKSQKVIKGLRASITGKNLLLLTKYTGPDPQIAGNTDDNGTGSMGIDDYPAPVPRSFNFTLSATF